MLLAHGFTSECASRRSRDSSDQSAGVDCAMAQLAGFGVRRRPKSSLRPIRSGSVSCLRSAGVAGGCGDGGALASRGVMVVLAAALLVVALLVVALLVVALLVVALLVVALLVVALVVVA